MRGRFNSVSDRIEKTERRLKTLTEYIRQSKNYHRHRELFRQYKQRKPSKQEAFYETNRADLALFEASKRYLENVINGRTILLVKPRKEEAARLTAEKENLYREYHSQKDEVHDAEIIKYNAERAMSADEPDTKIKRTREAEL